MTHLSQEKSYLSMSPKNACSNFYLITFYETIINQAGNYITS